jgi:DNA-binding NtrC family response regulator
MKPLPQPAPSPLSERWILVIDDEVSMRTLIEIVLRGQGWAVRTAEGADAAMEVLHAAAPAPALLICDVLMPGMNGLDLVRKITARIPGLAVIFISGHLTDVSWWPSDLREHRFLAKPFENAQLVALVREAFGESASAS